MRKGAIIIGVVLALAAFAIGCGGGGDETTAPPTKAQFIKQADAICSQGSQLFNTLYQRFVKVYPLPGGKRRRLGEYAKAVETVLAPATEWELEKLRELGVPRGEGHAVDAILVAIEDGLAKVERHPGVQANAERQFKQSSELARAYGLEICGS